MNKIIKSSLFLLTMLSPLSYATTVITSIKPFQLIAIEITQGITEPESLISSTASPHDYAMKPSDLKTVKRADLVIWFGPELEPFLEKVLLGSENSLQLSESDIAIDEHDDSDETSHEGHDHGRVDPHIWLGPTLAKQIARVITLKLSEIDQENAVQYQANFTQFVSNLDKSVTKITAELAPYKNKGYYVFHDAYGYFESYFQLNKIGYFTLSPDRKPGAKTLIQIRSALKNGAASCVFSEPQFKPATVESVIRGSDVFVGVLDPLATDFEPTSGAYFKFIEGLASAYKECLSY